MLTEYDSKFFDYLTLEIKPSMIYKKVKINLSEGTNIVGFDFVNSYRQRYIDLSGSMNSVDSGGNDISCEKEATELMPRLLVSHNQEEQVSFKYQGFYKLVHCAPGLYWHDNGTYRLITTRERLNCNPNFYAHIYEKQINDKSTEG